MKKLTVWYDPRRRTAGSGGKNTNSGFTLLETLLVVAILVILMGLSVVGVARYRDHLKIIELDNAARDIYMAAQNRAVLLQNSGQLDSQFTKGGDVVKLSAPSSNGGTRYISSHMTAEGIVNELVPVGTVDPTLRENGEFYVVYDPASGSVTDVFYVEKKDTLEHGIDEALGLITGGDGNNRNGRMRHKPMVGYYGGKNADEIGTKPLPTPGVEVFITNGDELKLTVKFTMPSDGLPPSGVTLNRTASVTLKYPAETGTEISLTTETIGAGRLPEVSPSGRTINGDTAIAAGETVSYTWVLDSLVNGQFKDLVSGDLGDDFTVKASLKLTADGYIDSAYYATGTDNSLFAKGSTYGTDATGAGTGTAKIANLRHLQNLCDSASSGFTSNVGQGIKHAQQLCDIDCDTYLTNTAYEFVPIVNANLGSYNGKYEDKNTHIYSLSTKSTTDAGLFGTVSSKLDINNCRVCWKETTTTDDEGNEVRETTAKKLADTANHTYVYAVSGTNAGGLIGMVSSTGEVTIKNSFAATTVKGTGNAGGLIGSVASGGNVSISNSYADCYLNGGTNVGGLVGSGTVAALTNCYAAGFIVNPANNTQTAGLLNGSVTTASNTYSVMRTMEAGKGTVSAEPKTLTYGNRGDGKGTTVRYLYDVSSTFTPTSGAFASAPPETHVYNLRHRVDSTAEELKPPYPFLGLKDTEGNVLPHYGDWCGVLPAVIRGMVYYEEYAHSGASNASGVPNDSAYVGAAGKYIDSSGSDFTSYPLWNDFGNSVAARNNPVVTKDGYALLFMGGSVSIGTYEVKYGDTQIWTLENMKWTCKWTSTGEAKFGEGTEPDPETAQYFTLPRVTDKEPEDYRDLPGENYILLLLPKAVVTGNFAYADTTFYQMLSAENKSVSGEDPRDFYFNPHFAKTVELSDKTETLTAGTAPAPVYIRTARHLYDLSRLYDTRHLYNDADAKESDADFIKNLDGYIKNNYYNKGYTFLQELDIDYDTYHWYGDEPDEGPGSYRVQHPIGVGVSGQTGSESMDLNQAFCGTYNGGCHIIRNVVFKETGYYLGLFGMTEKWGPKEAQKTPVLKDIVYEMDPATTVTITTPDSMKNQQTGVWSAFRSVGALVGKNDGLMDNCAVFGVNMEMTGKYIGGLLGYNQDTVQNCAAEVASLTVTLYSEVLSEFPCAGGLVGKQNTPDCKIEKSYAVGKLVCVGSQDKKPGEAIAGLLAHKGKVNDCYAAVDLVVNSGVSNVERFGLCRNENNENATYIDSKGITQVSNDKVAVTNSYWLKDVYVYRGTKYNITATTDYADSVRGVTFASLKTSLTDSSWKAADNTVLNIPQGASYTSTYAGKIFPYLTGVKTTLTRSADGLITDKVTTRQSIHYGLWPAPLPVGLAYYEVYKNTNDCGVYGKFESVDIKTLKEDKDDPTENDNPNVTKDGYALVFEGTTDVPVGDYKIEYGGGTSKKTFTLIKDEKEDDKEWYWRPEGSTTRYDYPSYTTTVDGVTYTVVPLPTSVVTEKLNDSTKFYQKLVYGTGLFSERTFYFNPHFAKTVKAEKGADGNVVAPEAPKNEKGEGVSIRTPRHFYALSRFQVGSGNLEYDQADYYFLQELDLDYNTYYDSCTSYGAAGFRPSKNDVTGTPAAGYADHYYKQPSITIEHPDACNGAFKGTYDGGNHTIRNVFYETPTKDLQYLGLFKMASPKNLTYEVPDNIEVDLTNDVAEPEVDGYQDGIKVGTLLGGSGYDLENCTVKMNNLTVTSSKAKIYVGGMTGYVNYAKDSKNRVEITGTLSVKCTSTNEGYEMNVAAGGMVGVILRGLDNCTGKVNAIEVEGNRYCYAGGLVGRTAANSNSPHPTIDSLKFDPRRIQNCSVEVGKLSVKGTGYIYGGGLAGWSDRINDCNAVVTGSLTATGTDGGSPVNAGGLAGSACDVRNCSAVAATVTATGSDSYAGGLLGVVKMTFLTQDIPENYPKVLQAVNSYAAVAKVEGGKKADAFCGHWVDNIGENQKYGPAVSVSFSNNYFLNGDANSWRIGSTNNTETSTAIDSDRATGMSYDELKNLADALGTAWGTFTGTDVYPFPVSTEKDGSWYYPSTVWPKQVTNPASLLSEDMESAPKDVEPAPGSDPEDAGPALLPEPGTEDAPEELGPALLPEPGIEAAPEELGPAPLSVKWTLRPLTRRSRLSTRNQRLRTLTLRSYVGLRRNQMAGTNRISKNA